MNKTIIKQVKNDKGVIFNAEIYKDKKENDWFITMTQDIKEVLENLVKFQPTI
jgi:hypothetical protein